MADAVGRRGINHSDAGKVESQSLHTASQCMIYAPLQPLAVLRNQRSTARDNRRTVDPTALQLKRLRRLLHKERSGAFEVSYPPLQAGKHPPPAGDRARSAYASRLGLDRQRAAPHA